MIYIAGTQNLDVDWRIFREIYIRIIFVLFALESSERREETLSVEVLTIKDSYSLCNIRCKIVSADMEIFVLLPAQNVKKLKLKDHSKFRIYPPW